MLMSSFLDEDGPSPFPERASVQDAAGLRASPPGAEDVPEADRGRWQRVLFQNIESFGGAYLTKSLSTNYFSPIAGGRVSLSDRLGIVEPLMHDAEFGKGSGANLSLFR